MGEEPCFIYAICHMRDGVMTGPVKVGISQAPHIRLRELQVGSPYKLAISVCILLDHRKFARDVESAVHASMENVRLNGEWFDIHPLEATGEICFALASNHGFRDRDGLQVDVRGRQ